MATGKDKTAGPDELDVLLSEIEIGPYKIKPWSFGRLKKVLPPLLAILPPLKDMGITIDNAEEKFKEHWLDIIMLLPDAIKYVGEIIGVTLIISEDEVEEIDPDLIMPIALTIIAQNVGRIKNSLPLIMSQCKSMVRAA